MIPTDVIGLNIGLIVISGTAWGAVWHFIIKEKISNYNELIASAKIQIIQVLFDHNTIMKAAYNPDKQGNILKNAVKKLETIDNQRIDSLQIDKFFFFSLFFSIVAIIIKLLEPNEGSILALTFTYQDFYNIFTVASPIMIFSFMILVYKANQRIGNFKSVDSLVAYSNLEVTEDE
ncbi:MAG: hypothetical protein Q7K34_02170 [archaeon]|nr:hypothetical protein [archaeon]